jgi:single-stranded-DNA-specific exonuclease
MTRWLDPIPVNIPPSFTDLNLHPLVAQTLLRRGFNSPADIETFLYSDSQPSTPFPNIEPAVERILMAIRRNEIICVWGDFDVDGQTSTTVLVQALRSIEANVVYYIPIRGKEGHGVHIDSLKPMIDNGAKLIVTCDTGSNAHAAIDYANSRGVDVIVTDHHDLGEALPNAVAIINPKLLPKDHRLANLAGVGVAYKLAESLLHTKNLPPDNLLDLVALGLIADVALLKGETRSLAQKGIKALQDAHRVGLIMMAELSDTKLETLTEETIGFTFAPRLNALGRLGDANPAVELLLTKDPVHARVLATQIEGLNLQRKLLTSQVYKAAETQLRDNPGLLSEPAIVLTHPNWPGGVVGIVANKLVRKYHKPVILLTESADGIMRGSARSVEGLHITEAIATQEGILRGFGGHPMAAGLSFEADKLNEFVNGLRQAIENQLGGRITEDPTLQIDAWLELNEITLELANSLEVLAPFGAGNPPIIMASHGVTLKTAATIGKTKDHRRLVVEDENGNTQSLLWWNAADEEVPEAGSKIDISYSLRTGSYRGQKQLTIQLEELRVFNNADKPVEIHEAGLELRDMRLQTSIRDFSPKTLIWAEGIDKSKGKSRFELYQADEFAIYTPPPSSTELKSAIEIVKPRTIYILANQPGEEKTEDFLVRLAGLCKYTIKKRAGKTTIKELCAAMASREIAIQFGLEWLSAGGEISLIVQGDQISISSMKQIKNTYLQAELYIALKGILSEISAYRKYWSTAKDITRMINS